MASIPREILLDIVARINPRDKATLLACHAASRDLRTITRLTLFSNIILALSPDNPTKELQDFYAFVSARPYIASSIQNIRINGITGVPLSETEVEDTDGSFYDRMDDARGPYNCNVDIAPLHNALALLPQLKTLRLYHVHPRYGVTRVQTETRPIHVPEVTIAIPSFDGEDVEGGEDEKEGEEEEDDDEEGEDEYLGGTKLVFNLLSMFDSIGKLGILSRPVSVGYAEYIGLINTPLVPPSHLKVDTLWVEKGNDAFWRHLLQLTFVSELRGLEPGWQLGTQHLAHMVTIIQLSSKSLDYLRLGNFLDLDCFHLSVCPNLKTLAIRMSTDSRRWAYYCIHSWINLVSFLSSQSKAQDSLRALEVVRFEISTFRDTVPQDLEKLQERALAPLEKILLELAERKLREVQWRSHSALGHTTRAVFPILHARGLLKVVPDDTMQS